MNANLPHWDVYRIELVFLNPMTGGWQLFQEGRTVAGQEYYRREIQLLLETIRGSFAKRALTAGDLIRMSEPDKATTVIVNLAKAILPLHEDPTTKPHLLHVLDLHEKLVSQSDLDPKSRRRIKQVLRAIAKKDNLQFPLEREIAHDLISTIPIHKDWDVFGGLAYQQSPGMKSFIRPARRAASKKPTGWQSFFTYRISYPENAEMLERSRSLLHYPVSLELCAGDLRTGKAIVRPPIRDYFDYCYEPTDELSRSWYRYYGALIDALQRGLGNRENDGSRSRDVIIVAYPLRAAGFMNFVQLYVRPTGVAKPTAEQCWQDWYALHERGGAAATAATDLMIMKESVRELLVHTRISAFQWYVSRDAKRRKSSRELFARHAPHLVEMESFASHNMWWGYVQQEASPWLQWDRASTPVNDVDNDRLVPVTEGMAASLVWTPATEPHKAELFRGTSQQRLTGQWRWLRSRILRRKLFGRR